MIERSFVIIKPDAVERRLIGRILSRFEDRGLTIRRMHLITISQELAERHYQEHVGKPFFDGLIKFITSTPSVIIVIEGEEAISDIRTMCGDTNPAHSTPGTIRGDFATMTSRNIIHSSDSPDSAKREIYNFFGDVD